MDIDMPKVNGIEATRQIKEEMPECAVAVLTVHADDENLFDAIKAGASGYLLKDAKPDEMIEAIRAAARGEGALHPSLVRRVMAEFSRVAQVRTTTKEVFAELTRREVEVLELVGNGLRNREIGRRLQIREKTVRNHVSNILSKLQVNGRTEAAILATRHGLAD
jgi:two-component system response regulator DegU